MIAPPSMLLTESMMKMLISLISDSYLQENSTSDMGLDFRS